jgi:ATP-dependent protease ClpP protease subunit
MNYLKNKTDITHAHRMEDEEFGVMKDQVPMFNEQIITNIVDAYLDGPILSAAYYRPLVHYLNNMREHDKLKLWINTGGGDVGGMMQIIDAMQNAEGEVIALVTGEAYSAGSIIALSSPNLIVSQNASMMCHAPSYGIGRMKFADAASYVDFSTKQLRKIAQDAYADFLSATEIEQMLNGKDFWFDYEEINVRLTARAAAQVAKAEASEKAANEVQVKPKRVPKKQPKTE